MSDTTLTKPKTKPISQEMQSFIECGLNVIKAEAKALSNLTKQINQSFAVACQHMLNCKGRIIVTGVGKSGHIGKKIAATFASTGSPAFFIHPTEASHGDLGMITTKDLVLALSNSGETAEILNILPFIKRIGIPLITITGDPTSQLAKLATVHINASVEKEACLLGLAPTSSTTATLAMGDALAISILQAKGFTADDFARSHPAGKLGKKLLIKIMDIMHTGDAIPKVYEHMKLTEVIVEMSRKRLGMTTVVKDDSDDQITGIFTDGDLRRVLDRDLDIHTTLVKTVMSKKFMTINPNILAAEAVCLMENFKINGFPVVDKNNKIVGAFNMHDLLQAGVV